MGVTGGAVVVILVDLLGINAEVKLKNAVIFG